MNDTRQTAVTLPWLAAVCFCIVASAVGFVGPVFRCMLADFGYTPDTLAWWNRMIMGVHWHWTMPAGLVVSALLIWGSRRWPVRTTRAVALTLLATSLLAVVGVVVLMFTPIRIEHGVIGG